MADTDLPPAPAGYDPDTVYDVRFTQVVLYLKTKLLPRFEHQVSGRALSAIVADYGEEAIHAATPRT